MFGTIKKAMVIAAVAAVGAVAPSVASADVWKDGATTFAGAAHVGGSLTMSVGTSTTTCTVTATLDLSNPGSPSVAHGQVTSFLLGAAAGGSCSTNAPNCTVTATADTSTPWTVSTSGTNVTISGIKFTNTYGGGATCSLNGLQLTATGSITGSAASNVITFSNAAGLTTPLGPATVSGSVSAYAENGTGGPNLSRPITLG